MENEEAEGKRQPSFVHTEKVTIPRPLRGRVRVGVQHANRHRRIGDITPPLAPLTASPVKGEAIYPDYFSLQPVAGSERALAAMLW